MSTTSHRSPLRPTDAWLAALALAGACACSGDPEATTPGVPSSNGPGVGTTSGADTTSGFGGASSAGGPVTGSSAATTSADTTGVTSATTGTSGGTTSTTGGSSTGGTGTATDGIQSTTDGATTDGTTTGAGVTTGGGGSGGDVTFSTPVGTIPNDPMPDSSVDLPVGSWPDGLISPTMDEGIQINQPTVVNGYLLIGGNERFWIYDVSDPSSPQKLSEFTTPGATGGEAESHTISFARYGDTYYMVTISGRGIDTWDITDPRSPQHVDQLGVPGTNYGDYTEAVWGVTWQGQYIYVGATNNGVKVVDAADPANLSIAGEIAASQYGGVSAGPVDAIGNVLVVMTPKESGGVATLDISDPTNPTRLASFSTNISYIGQFYRRYAFLISPLRVWDVLSDPSNIGTGSTPLDTLNHGGAEYLSFQDDYLFLGMVRAEISGTPGASKIDVSNIQNMQQVSSIWGRQDRGGLNDDQFNIAFGNLLVLGDDQAPYAGWVIAAHDTEPDTTAPVVDTVIPKDQESGVPTTSRIGVSFSDNIELATVNGASFIVRPVGGQPLSGKYGVRMGVVNFDPDEDLEPGTTYEVVLPAGGMADFVGNTLTSEWTSTFTTN